MLFVAAAVAAEFPCCVSQDAQSKGVRFGSVVFSCESPLAVLSYKRVEQATISCSCSVANTNCSQLLNYNPQFSQFQCAASNKQILALEQVNDNFCDCGDDEPNTSACSDGVFYCAGLQTLLPSSRVQDGVKDCCDCSDEPQLGKECVNTCNEEFERRERVRAALDAIVLDGLEEARAVMQNSADRIKALQKEIDTLKQYKSSQARLVEETNALVLRFVEAFKDVPLETWKQVATTIAPSSFVSDDTATPQSIFAKLVEQKRYREFYDQFQPLASSAVSAVTCDAEQVSQWLTQFDFLTSSTTTTRQGDVDKRITQVESLLKHDFGPNGTLVSLLDQEFSMKRGEHTFTFKAFDSCMQGPSSTSLGKFVRWTSIVNEAAEIPQEINEGASVPRPSFVMEFDKGQACYQGTIRTTKVFFRCGSGGNELIQVFEPEMCRYVFLMRSPVACLGSEVFTAAASESSSYWRRFKRWFGR